MDGLFFAYFFPTFYRPNFDSNMNSLEPGYNIGTIHLANEGEIQNSLLTNAGLNIQLAIRPVDKNHISPHARKNR